MGRRPGERGQGRRAGGDKDAEGAGGQAPVAVEDGHGDSPFLVFPETTPRRDQGNL
jgi:hypothetical protein